MGYKEKISEYFLNKSGSYRFYKNEFHSNRQDVIALKNEVNKLNNKVNKLNDKVKQLNEFS